MQTLSGKISGIELKLRQLALKLERLQEENIVLLKENRQLKTKLSQKPSTIVKTIKESATVPTGVETDRAENQASSKKIRKEIDQYIKEIDKCIEWLSNS